MDTAKIYDNIPFIGLLITIALMMLPIAPGIKNILVWGGMIISIGSIFALDYAFTLAASKYTVLEAVIAPSNKLLYLFLQEPEQGIHSHQIDPENPNRHHTHIELAFPVQLPPHYMNITKITIEHDLRWEDRIIFNPGKTLYKGYKISHNKIARISLWEPNRNPATQYHLEDNPRFTLSEGPRDWYISDEPVSPLDTQTQITAIAENGQTANCQSCTHKKDATDYREWYNDLHQRYIRLEGYVETLNNQFKGALSRTRDVTKLVLEVLLTLLAAHTSIAEAVREIKPKFWTLTKELAIVIIAVVFLVLYAASPEFRASIQQNLLGYGIIAGIIVFGAYMLLYNKKSR